MVADSCMVDEVSSMDDACSACSAWSSNNCYYFKSPPCFLVRVFKQKFITNK